MISILFFLFPAFADPISFENALNEILNRNHRILVQRERLEALKAVNLKDKYAFWPSLYSKATHVTSNEVGGSFDTFRRVELGMDINLFKFGGDINAMRAREFEESASENAVENEYLEAEEDAVQAILAYLQNYLSVEVQKRRLEVSETILEIARQRFQKGFLPKQEVSKLTVDKENTLSDLHDLEIIFEEAQLRLIQILGHSNVLVKWPWKEFFKRAPDPNFLNEKSIKEGTNVVIEGKKKSFEAIGFRLLQSKSNFYPSLDAKVGYGFSEWVTQKTQGPSWLGSITLTFPLFNQYRDYGTYHSLLHQKKIAELEFEKSKRDVPHQIQSFLRSFKISLKSAEAREALLKESRNLYQDNLKRFQRGLIPVNDLVLDIGRLYKSEQLVVDGWAHVHGLYSKLCHSAGNRLEICLKST